MAVGRRELKIETAVNAACHFRHTCHRLVSPGYTVWYAARSGDNPKLLLLQGFATGGPRSCRFCRAPVWRPVVRMLVYLCALWCAHCLLVCFWCVGGRKIKCLFIAVVIIETDKICIQLSWTVGEQGFIISSNKTLLCSIFRWWRQQMHLCYT